MRKAVENGFTIYVEREDDVLKGLALKYVLGNGLQPVELGVDRLQVLEQFSILDYLEDGRMLQVYKGSYGSYMYPVYIAQIGTVKTEGAYCGDECFEVVAEGVGSDFYDAFLSLSKECSKSVGDVPIKKTYRLYGSDKYEVMRKRG